jgi:hypothetical protein
VTRSATDRSGVPGWAFPKVRRILQADDDGDASPARSRQACGQVRRLVTHKTTSGSCSPLCALEKRQARFGFSAPFDQAGREHAAHRALGPFSGMLGDGRRGEGLGGLARPVWDILSWLA